MSSIGKENRWLVVVVGVLVIAAGGTQVFAVMLNPGGNVSLSGTTTSIRPELGGTVLEDFLTPFEIRDTGGALLYQAKLQHRVSISNVTGWYIFEYRIRDPLGGLSGNVNLLETTGFTGYMTDVDYLTDGLGDVGPDYASRSSDGDEVDFGFINGIPGTQESFFMFVYTDATAYAVGGGETSLSLITGESVAVPIPTAIPIPEPATLCLLALGSMIPMKSGLKRKQGP